MNTGIIAMLTSTLLTLTGTSQKELLVAHNTYRYAANVPELQWSQDLTAEAQRYAQHLADTHSFQHSGVKGEGENIWEGTTGAYSLTQMVSSWGEEKTNFKSGTFPNVSKTGDWRDVGHYTQMIWRKSTEVGCGVASNSQYDILVCRYKTAGNVIGSQVE